MPRWRSQMAVADGGWNASPKRGVSLAMDPCASSSAVTVYWRPGCPSCASLRRRLRRTGLVTCEVNIWQDPAGAATVRLVAGGNETVPTVVVGDTALVNPSAATVLDAAHRAGIATAEPRGPSTVRSLGPILMVLQWGVVVALLVGSLVLNGTGHAAASWVLDGVALCGYVAFRALRSRLAGDRHQQGSAPVLAPQAPSPTSPAPRRDSPGP